MTSEKKSIPVLLILGAKGSEEDDEDEDEEKEEKLEKALAKSKEVPPILVFSKK